MSKQLRDTIYQELSAVSIIDPHTHINALQPGSETLADILGYHYYTELAHSAGMPKGEIEEAGIDPKEKVGRLIENMGSISNTIQYSWFVEMAQALLGFEDDQVTPDNWESLYDTAVEKMERDDWSAHVLKASKLDGVFLTNDFDDPLEGFDTQTYIPCLRTDDLVFHLGKSSVRQRLEQATGYAPKDVASLNAGIGALFDHFVRKGAKACAISLPPDFAPSPVSVARASTALAAIHRDGVNAAESHQRAIGNYVFWSLAQRCDDYRLPFDLMIGVNRGVYEDGVYQGQDLYDSRVSLIQYKTLFNAFPQVTFPLSVLASVTNQELTSYAWIFPNVVTNGHWWYSNTPTYIEHDASARLEAVPRTKQIGYYSDMYKLEFALPKFNMYKRILAKILAERFVLDRGWSESRAVEFGLEVLRDNSERIFKVGRHDAEPYLPAPELEPVASATANTEDDSGAIDVGAIGMIGAALLDDDEPAAAIDLDPESTIDMDPASAPTIDLDPGLAPTIDLEEDASATVDFEPRDEPSVDPSAETIDMDFGEGFTLPAEAVTDATEGPESFTLEGDASPDDDTVDGREVKEDEDDDISIDTDAVPDPSNLKLDLDLDLKLDDPPSDTDDFKLDL